MEELTLEERKRRLRASLVDAYRSGDLTVAEIVQKRLDELERAED